ncbi:hypothetical protein ACNOYE_35915 [Nannocystaceae bacterium ST9]
MRPRMAWEVRLIEGFDEYSLVRAATRVEPTLRPVEATRARAIVSRWLRGHPSAAARVRELIGEAPRLARVRESEAELLARALARLGDPGPAGLRLFARGRPLRMPTPGMIVEPPPRPEPEPEPEPELEWIYVRLLDAQGNPRPNEAWEVTLPDGSIRSGTLDDQGNARIEGVPPGRCLWRFPDLHPDEWRA